MVAAGPLVRSGFTLAGGVLVLDRADLPTGTWVPVADDDGSGAGAVEECDQENHLLVRADRCGAGCPLPRWPGRAETACRSGYTPVGAGVVTPWLGDVSCGRNSRWVPWAC